MQEQQEGLNNLIKEYSELFNKYDFKLSREIPEDAYKAIKIGGNNIGENLFIVFTHKDIKSTMEEKMKEYIEEQNEKIRKNGKKLRTILTIWYLIWEELRVWVITRQEKRKY